MEDKIVEVIDQIDMSDLELPSFAIYKNPKDYPGKAVARLFEKEYPTDVVIIKKDLPIGRSFCLVKRKIFTVRLVPNSGEPVPASCL